MAMRNMYEIGEVWTCGCRNMRVETDRQTDMLITIFRQRSITNAE